MLVSFSLLLLVLQGGDLERARELLISGRAAEAAAIYRELSRAEPKNADLLLNLAIAAYKAGNPREAAGASAAALSLKPALLPARLFLGASYLDLGEYSKAVESLGEVIAANPNERNGRLMLGEALLRAGQAGAAVSQFEAAAGMLPDNPRVWYGLGRACEELGRKEAAQAAWERLAALPASAESHIHLAEVHDAEQRWRESSGEWREALRLSAGNLRIRMRLSWSLFRVRDYPAVMELLQPMLESGGAAAPFLYGASLLNLQKPGDAIPYLRAAIARDGHLLPAKAALGQGLLQTGHAADAIPLLRESLAVDTDGSTHFQLYRAYQLTGQEAEARQALAAYRRVRSQAPAPAKPD
ncbi:MAG: tetratricopeptide repeat protein [Bryobacteraceae bacterium]